MGTAPILPFLTEKMFLLQKISQQVALSGLLPVGAGAKGAVLEESMFLVLDD